MFSRVRSHLAIALALTAPLALALTSVGACATQTALLTRDERLALTRQGAAEFAARREERRTDTPAAAPAAAVTITVGSAVRPSSPRPTIERTLPHGVGLEALNQEDRDTSDRYFGLRRFRETNVALAAALETFNRDGSDEHRQDAQTAFSKYQEAASMNRITTVLAVLCLTGCNSISSQIRSLNAEDAKLASQISIMQEHHKAIIALIATLEQVKRDGGTRKSEADVDEARARYDQTGDRM